MKTKLFNLIIGLCALVTVTSCGKKQEGCKKECCKAQCEQHVACAQTNGCADTCKLSCCSATVEKLDIESLLNKEYVVSHINGNALEMPAEERPTMHFSWTEQQVSGSTSCNNHFARFTAKSCGAISFTEAGCTRMACPDMTTEDAFLAAFAQVTRMTQTPEGINLTDDQGNALLSLQTK
ncbi:MAG: META domain-containing protein [Paludibacteraceae bacterium]|nr:META domain-containing protein [Paludibacteraceae bacterium]